MFEADSFVGSILCHLELAQRHTHVGRVGLANFALNLFMPSVRERPAEHLGERFELAFFLLLFFALELGLVRRIHDFFLRRPALDHIALERRLVLALYALQGLTVVLVVLGLLCAVLAARTAPPPFFGALQGHHARLALDHARHLELDLALGRDECVAGIAVCGGHLALAGQYFGPLERLRRLRGVAADRIDEDLALFVGDAGRRQELVYARRRLLDVRSR